VNRENGVDTGFCERGHEALFAAVRKRLGPIHRLATSMALEHLTAVFARELLDNPRLMAGADPRAAALWYWHAFEELEHKSVVFDVYREVGGGYWVRVLHWVQVLAIFHSIMFIQLTYLLKQSGQLGNFRDLIRGFRYLFGLRGLFTRVFPSYLAYLKPGFHPWRQDGSPLAAHWQKFQAEYGHTLVLETAARS
jgi:predicted metal-dependent hydrolase